ncbi:hypothetical protein [Maribacter stanieri]|jgi:hypothetical protein|uniref:hypothetical protein n=1 Tax=Maribacter stanieri TaxID=440514 RepID=UPI0024942707|nr:hypothetical protein [Maribacter stanieri]|tara:strand:+ start:650 stop:1183 length:534 start_codon:yes stop_codon:yes gene_type:complete
MFKKYISFICLLVLFTACDKIDELTKFDMEYSQRATIPSSTGINLPFDVFTPEMETNSESTFAVNDTRKDLIEEIKLTDLELVMISPEEADFSFLNSIEVYISADGLEEILIANLDEVPEDAGNVITLDTSDTDLKEYIKKDEFSLRLNTVTDELMSTDHELEVNSTFFVDAKILGL